MQDAFNRTIDYMRVSITDRCNLRCNYCMPQDVPFTPHDDILRYEELLRICRLMGELGVHTIKVTGGEPLVRRGCLDFLRQLSGLPQIETVTLTTNATLLADALPQLLPLGLDCVNISLDTLRPQVYAALTGRDAFAEAWAGLTEAVDAGLRVKVNCVPLQGVNDTELASIARIAETLPVDVRFIELMPTGCNHGCKGIPTGQVKDMLRKEWPSLTADETRHGNGPARYLKSPQLMGSIGFISAISNHFCASCNRVRLTSEGFLKLCLYHESGLDLRALLRSGATDDDIKAKIKAAIAQKPRQHEFGNTDKRGISAMSRIGG